MRSLLLVCLLNSPLLSAPVPPPRAAPPLTQSYLVGTWKLEWGRRSPSYLTFLPNGRHHYRLLGDDGPSSSFGWWEFNEGKIFSKEWYSPEGTLPAEVGPPSTYQTIVTPTGPSTFDGVWVMQGGATIPFKAVRIGGR